MAFAVGRYSRTKRKMVLAMGCNVVRLTLEAVRLYSLSPVLTVLLSIKTAMHVMIIP
jgi:hypothetical protein